MANFCISNSLLKLAQAPKVFQHAVRMGPGKWMGGITKNKSFMGVGHTCLNGWGSLTEVQRKVGTP